MIESQQTSDADVSDLAVPSHSAAYRPSHQWLLRPLSARLPSQRSVPRLGAVVVPISRPFCDGLPGLELAVRLSHDLKSPLIVICSKDARAEDFPLHLRDGDRVTVIDLPLKRPWLPRLTSTGHRLSTLWRSNDVGPKRNLGIAAAVAAGERYVLFIDDDITEHPVEPTLSTIELESALLHLDSDPALRAVGWTLEDFDDNSVAGHARRLAGLPQTIFIGGGALLVRCDVDTPFFPDIYNEDWLFLMALAQSAPDYARCLGWGGRVAQREYDPFTQRRARSEEAGDILAEGLMNLLEDDGPGFWAGAMSFRFWRLAETRRAVMLREIITRLRTQGLADPARPHLLVPAGRSLAAALRMHTDLRPTDLRSYVVQWREDLHTWRRHLKDLREAWTDSEVTIDKVLADWGLGVR